MDKALKDMTSIELTETKAKLCNIGKTRSYDPPGKKIYGYLTASYAEYLPECIEYAYENDLIDKKKPFNFVTWAVKNTIRTIMLRIRQSRQNPPLKDSQEYPE